MTERWADRDYLRGSQYKTDANLAARQSIYAYQHPRIDLAARVLDLAAPGPSDTVVDVGRGDDPAAMGERLPLDDGESLARSFFPEVTRHDFVAGLRVPGPGPIKDYVRSMSGTSQHAEPEAVAEAVAAAFPMTAGGYYAITSHSGCLVCIVG